MKIKRAALALVVTLLAGLLGGCLSLKPFTQDELNRISSGTGATWEGK